MSKLTLKRDIQLLYEIGSLRFVDRTWKQFLGPYFQNLSEHTLRVLWFSILIAKYEGAVNVEKIMKMALIHDLAESRSGDANYVTKMYVDRHKEKAIKDTLFGTKLEKELLALWQEIEKHQSHEAKIVSDADKLDPILEYQEQESLGHKVVKKWKIKQTKSLGARLHTKTGKLLWQAIQKSDPSDWHLKAGNRFNTGDWK
jgi:putative hydrolase of HD superfamily